MARSQRKPSGPRTDRDPRSTSRQVAAFIAKFDPAIVRLARASRTALRKRFPTAVELVYDNYNALAIGWAPNERASEVIVSLALFARGINLYFTQGGKGYTVIKSVSAKQRPRRPDIA